VVHDLKASLEIPGVSDSELMDVADRSYSNLRHTKDQLQDSASRILAAIAFLTAAAVAIFRESVSLTPDGKAPPLWPTLWVSGYLLCVVLGALFLLAGMWSGVWGYPRIKLDASEVEDKKAYLHSFVLLRNLDRTKNKKQDIGDLTAFQNYRTELVNAYLRDRNEVAREARELTHLLHWGGVCLIGAFYFLVALTSTLILQQTSYGWVALWAGSTLLSAVLCVGSYIRAQHKFRWGWPRSWAIVTGVFLLATIIAVFAR
jgi:hypothetical protein